MKENEGVPLIPQDLADWAWLTVSLVLSAGTQVPAPYSLNHYSVKAAIHFALKH